MDSLLRRAIERREREAAEQRELADTRPRCEICQGALCPGMKRKGQSDTATRCGDCLDVVEIRRSKVAPVVVQDEIFFDDGDVERYIQRMAKVSDESEDWTLYQELMAKEEDRPEPVQPLVFDHPREAPSPSDGGESGLLGRLLDR